MSFEKVDVAVQSYKKPESLIYTLLSLKKTCGEHIDTVYIQDDRSLDKTAEHYLSPYFIEAMKPIRIVVKVNDKKSPIAKKMKIRNDLSPEALAGSHYFRSENIRYQYGIEQTDKKYIFLIHDDIAFLDDVLALYLEEAEKDTYALIGDLAPCWVCPYAVKKHCTPAKVNSGVYPSRLWPLDIKKSFHRPYLSLRRDCRIIEWSCLLRTDIARELGEKGIYFGQYEKGGDVGAYYFDYIVTKTKYKFADPCTETKSRYYQHGWQGHSGHSVWVDQGSGIHPYQAEMIRNRLLSDFGFDYAKTEAPKENG